MKLSEPKVKIAHIDDNFFFRLGLKMSLKQSPNYNLEISVSDTSMLLHKMNACEIDILLLGDYPGNNNLSDGLLGEILKSNPSMLIVAFQSDTNFAQINRLIKKGIKGYIPKELSEEEFYRTLFEVKMNGFFFTNKITKNLIELVQNDQKLSDDNLAFSDMEIKILSLVSKGHTADEISTELNKSKKTIEGYRFRMLKKTNVKNIAELVAWGFRNRILV